MARSSSLWPGLERYLHTGSRRGNRIWAGVKHRAKSRVKKAVRRRPNKSKWFGR